MHEKAQGNTADTTSKPSALTNSLLDRRTHEWRRRAELMLMFADALGGPSKIDDLTASKIASAADMRVIAEIARARFLRGDDCWFSRGTEPVFPPRSEPPLSMVF